MINYIWQYKK